MSESFYSAAAQGFYGAVILGSTFSYIGLIKALGPANVDVEGAKPACDGYAWLLTVDCVIKLVAFLFAVSIWPSAMMLDVILAAAFVYWMRAKWGV